MLRVLLSVKQSSQVEAAVKQLDNDQRDVLMKYIYRGFETPTEGSSAHLLLWHEKVGHHVVEDTPPKHCIADFLLIGFRRGWRREHRPRADRQEKGLMRDVLCGNTVISFLPAVVKM